MDELQIFEGMGFKVRTVIKDGEPWFVAKDVCDALELSEVSNSVKRLDDDEKLTRKLFVSGQNRDVILVSEPGVYNLVFTSNKPEAKQFKRWITHEVIPSIRKNGMYATESTLDKMLNNPDFLADILMKLKAESERRKLAETKVHILTHVNKTYTATEIAKEIGFRSANALNEDLRLKKIQYKVNDTWVLHAKYADLGYVEIKQQVLDSGKIIYHRKISGIGREWLLDLYKNENNGGNN